MAMRRLGDGGGGQAGNLADGVEVCGSDEVGPLYPWSQGLRGKAGGGWTEPLRFRPARSQLSKRTTNDNSHLQLFASCEQKTWGKL